MNVSSTLSFFVCCATLVVLGSLASGDDLSVSDMGGKNAKEFTSTVITPSNDRSFDPVPEPSTGSLILLGLGGVGLAMKLRKRA